YTDDRRVKLIVHQLHGLGKSWWIATKKALENQGTVITWALFRTAFYQRFFPVSYRKDKGAEFANLRQGQLNIEEYVAKFTSLLKFAPHVAISDEAQADQFINGLNPDVFTLVNTGRPNTFADALNHAKGAEAGLLRQRRAQFVPSTAKVAQENPQIPPTPRLMLAAAVVERKISLKKKENNSSVQVTVAPPVQVNSNNWELDRNLVITVPNVESNTTLNSAEECLAFVVFVINLDILPESALNVVRGVHRILRHRDQCQCQNGKHLLCISNHRINNRVDREEARHRANLLNSKHECLH
ncbi:Pol polyprotein, partial [Dorcoceras hygrometricum]